MAGWLHATALDLVERALGSGETVLILQTLPEIYTMATSRLQTSPDDACLYLTGLRDFQDQRVLGGVTFVNPFQGGNEPLLARVLPLS